MKNMQEGVESRKLCSENHIAETKAAHMGFWGQWPEREGTAQMMREKPGSSKV